ncbi:dTDP-glucose 4,6-dehydratase [Patescibacteria group bacterium]|nr:dTDP-glucose 4,6-dehydratase [Patescibacteria group bacterium]
MNLLITGGAGFIGSNLIRYWLKKYPKDKVVNLDKLTYAGNLDNLKDISDNPNYKFVEGDICDKKLVNSLMLGVDVVAHLAAESHVDRSIVDSTPFIVTNVLGTQVLLDSALENKVKRFHHISTDEVFGALALGSEEKFNEDTPYDPRSPYSASKAASDHLVRAYFHTHNLPITISNCSNNFGPFQYPEKFIPVTIINLIEGKKIPVYGDGKYVRDWLYVDDHCSALDLIIHKGRIGETYCIGGQKDKEYSNLEIIKLILKFMGKDDSSIAFVKDRPGHDRRYAVDWSKINSQLGWSPNHNLEERLRETVNWYKSNQYEKS